MENHLDSGGLSGDNLTEYKLILRRNFGVAVENGLFKQVLRGNPYREVLLIFWESTMKTQSIAVRLLDADEFSDLTIRETVPAALVGIMHTVLPPLQKKKAVRELVCETVTGMVAQRLYETVRRKSGHEADCEKTDWLLAAGYVNSHEMSIYQDALQWMLIAVIAECHDTTLDRMAIVDDILSKRFSIRNRVVIAYLVEEYYFAEAEAIAAKIKARIVAQPDRYFIYDVGDETAD